MTYLPRYVGPEPDAPSAKEMEAAIASGLVCSECHEEFTGGHGHPVVCEFCGRRLLEKLLDEMGLKLATRAERNRLEFQRRARQRKHGNR